MIAYIIQCVSVVIAITGVMGGDYYSKMWANSHEWTMCMRTAMFYALSTAGWLGLIRFQKDIFIPSIAWAIAGSAIAAIVGIWIFSEKPSTLQWIGIMFAIPAMFLMMLGGNDNP